MSDDEGSHADEDGSDQQVEGDVDHSNDKDAPLCVRCGIQLLTEENFADGYCTETCNESCTECDAVLRADEEDAGVCKACH